MQKSADCRNERVTADLKEYKSVKGDRRHWLNGNKGKLTDFWKKEIKDNGWNCWLHRIQNPLEWTKKAKKKSKTKTKHDKTEDFYKVEK